MPVNDLSPTDPDSTRDKRPVPVILASDPLRALWPHSSLERLWSFRRFGDGRSAVERLLDAFAADERFAPSLLVAPRSAIRVVREVLSERQSGSLQLMVVPDGLAQDAGALLATMEAATGDPDRTVVLVPANVHAETAAGLPDLLTESVAKLGDGARALVHVRRASARTSPFAYEVGPPDTVTGLRMAGPMIAMNRDDGAAAALGAETLFEPVGPVLGRARVFLTHIRNAAPKVTNTWPRTGSGTQPGTNRSGKPQCTPAHGVPNI